MILPALLTSNDRIAAERIRLAQQMSGWLHVDILDNTLYPFISARYEDMERWDFGTLSLEFHCMTRNPAALLETRLPVERMIIHYELKGRKRVYNELVSQDVETWFAIAPQTEIEDLELPDDIAGVMMMGVEPGQGGQELLPDTFDRLIQFRDFYPDVPLTIDGGVTLENIRELLACGVDNFVVGSALFSKNDPVGMYQQFKDMSDPLYFVRAKE